MLSSQCERRISVDHFSSNRFSRYKASRWKQTAKERGDLCVCVCVFVVCVCLCEGERCLTESNKASQQNCSTLQLQLQ